MASSSPASLTHAAQKFIDQHTITDPPGSSPDPCPICLDPYHPALNPCMRITGIIGCTHTFCFDCLRQFFHFDPRAPKACPMCRTPWLPAPRLVPPTSAPNTSRAHQRALPPPPLRIVEPRAAAWSRDGPLHPDLAELLELLQFREDAVDLQAQIVGADERAVVRRREHVAVREAAVAARERAMQGAVELALRHAEEESSGLLARQREELVRAFGEAQSGRR